MRHQEKGNDQRILYLKENKNCNSEKLSTWFVLLRLFKSHEFLIIFFSYTHFFQWRRSRKGQCEQVE